MGRPAKERQATTTRMYSETIRLARTMASWNGESMSDYLDRLVKEDAKRNAQDMIRGLQAIADEDLGKKPKGRKGAAGEEDAE